MVGIHRAVLNLQLNWRMIFFHLICCGCVCDNCMIVYVSSSSAWFPLERQALDPSHQILCSYHFDAIEMDACMA